MAKNTYSLNNAKSIGSQILDSANEIIDSIKPLLDIVDEAGNVDDKSHLAKTLGYTSVDEDTNEDTVPINDLLHDAINEYSRYVDDIQEYIPFMPDANSDLINTASLLSKYIQSIIDTSIDKVSNIEKPYLEKAKKLSPILLLHINEAIDHMKELANELINNQEGGWGKGKSKTEKLKTRLNNSNKITDGSIDSHRSYVAIVNGIPLKSSNINGLNKRYFHGKPLAAARKVVSQLSKGHKDKGIYTILPVDVNGIKKAVKIDLKEVTQGVVNAKGEKYMYSYFGWNENLSDPVVINKKNKDGSNIAITVTKKNIAIPVREYKNATEALAASNIIGSHIKAGKQK